MFPPLMFIGAGGLAKGRSDLTVISQPDIVMNSGQSRAHLLWPTTRIMAVGR
jgi:hypothetical protein